MEICTNLPVLISLTLTLAKIYRNNRKSLMIVKSIAIQVISGNKLYFKPKIFSIIIVELQIWALKALTHLHLLAIQRVLELKNKVTLATWF